ncbi:MAG: condensation domain-containing protein, partial [Nannocystaceae bacterium]
MAELVRSDTLPPGIQVVNFAGEHLPAEVAHRVYQRSQIEHAYNLYGPTEATIYVTAARIPRDSKKPLIGRPLPGARVYVLDRELAPVPFGVAGELFIGGALVGRGYFQRPELTAERFIPNPFGRGRLYCTGDLVRFQNDGQLEYLGRLDHQIKLRGFRIELGEIAAALNGHAAVEEAVVVARGSGSEMRLVAYWVAKPGCEDFDVGSLRTALGVSLPQFMVPEIYVRLTALPQTLNGKIDRKALPAPGVGDLRHADHRPPTTATEAALATLWSQVLGGLRVGIDDNFFVLGGHSLLAAQVLARLPELFGIKLPLRVLFERPTLTAFAELVDASSERAGDFAELRPMPHNGELPVSISQRRLWFLSQVPGADIAYNMPLVMRLHGPLNIGALTRSFNALIARHESLRTSFLLRDTGPTQVIHPPTTALEAEVIELIEVIELGGLAEAARNLEVTRRIDAAVHRPFVLEQAPLVHAQILQVAADEHVFVLVIHHIVADGWSLGVIERELSALYAAELAGHPAPLPPLPIQYADFSRWQAARTDDDSANEHLDFWRKTLADAPSLELPTDRPRPSVESFRGDHHTFVLDPSLTQGLHQVSREAGVTLFVTLLAAYNILLSRYAETEDVSIATGTANRRHPALNGQIGFFVDTLIVRTKLNGNPTVGELLGRVHDAVLAATEHEDLPFERVVDELRPNRSLDRNPLAQVGLTLQNYASNGLLLEGL